MSDSKQPIDWEKAADGSAPQNAQGDDRAKTLDSNSPRTRKPAEQVKVWEEEGGSPPQQISSTRSVKPKTEPKAGHMGSSKD